MIRIVALLLATKVSLTLTYSWTSLDFLLLNSVPTDESASTLRCPKYEWAVVKTARIAPPLPRRPTSVLADKEVDLSARHSF